MCLFQLAIISSVNSNDSLDCNKSGLALSNSTQGTTSLVTVTRVEFCGTPYLVLKTNLKNNKIKLLQNYNFMNTEYFKEFYKAPIDSNFNKMLIVNLDRLWCYRFLRKAYIYK